MKPNSADRELINLLKFFRDHWTYEGQESRENSFRQRRFANEDVESTSPLQEKLGWLAPLQIHFYVKAQQ